jgi:transcriptional regulator with GAF, ATPase, and Fis domain
MCWPIGRYRHESWGTGRQEFASSYSGGLVAVRRSLEANQSALRPHNSARRLPVQYADAIHQFEDRVVPSPRPPRRGRSAVLLTSSNQYMGHLVAQVKRVAREEVTVLLTGESGTGKGVLARVLHEHSKRAEGPFVEVNCASLPESVLESELFGHEKGAFTGAVRQRIGRLEQARGGTLFIDEVGIADPRVQTRLLRVLQERRFERVGGDRTMTADVRVVAATNADLGMCVRQGTFREDLYYRLHVVPFELPPLRDRCEDVPLLAKHFLRRRSSNHESDNHCQIDDEAMALLIAYPWPGNIRELENTLERMAVLGGPILRANDVPPEIVRWREQRQPEEMCELGAVSYREAREWFDRRFLCGALRRHNGVLTRVAEAIGMSRKYLYARLEHLDIDVENFRTSDRS